MAVCLLLLFFSQNGPGGESQLAFDSKPFKVWLDQIDDARAEFRKQAADALSAKANGIIESYSFPSMLADSLKFRDKTKPHLPKLMNLVQSKDPEVGNAALSALTAIGSDASGAVPLMERIIKDPMARKEHRSLCAYGLLHIDVKPVGPLLLELARFEPNRKALQAGEEERMKARTPNDERFEMFGIGFVAEELAGQLRQTGRMRMELPYLIEATKKSYINGIRLIAVATLAALGKNATDALPALRALVAETNPDLKVLAAIAVVSIEESDRSVAELYRQLDAAAGAKLADYVRVNLPELRWQRRALAESGDFAQTLTESLKRGDIAQRRAAMEAVVEIGSAAKVIESNVANLLNDTDPFVRKLAKDALTAIKSPVEQPKPAATPIRQPAISSEAFRRSHREAMPLGSLVPNEATYTVQQTDETLWGIARKMLNDGRRFREIYELNKDKLPSEYDLPVGVILRLPAGTHRQQTLPFILLPQPGL